MAYAQRTKITLSSLGDPAIIKTMDDNVRKHKMGVIMGEATDLIERTNPKDNAVMEGLKGMFRAIPDDEKNEPMESGLLWIPDAFHEQIAQQIRNAKANGEINFKVKFAIEVTVIRANNPQKYSWELLPMIDTEVKSPLDELQALYEAAKQKQLAAPKGRKAIGAKG